MQLIYKLQIKLQLLGNNIILQYIYWSFVTVCENESNVSRFGLSSKANTSYYREK